MGLCVADRDVIPVLAVAAHVHTDVGTPPARLASIVEGLAGDLEKHALLGIKCLNFAAKVSLLRNDAAWLLVRRMEGGDVVAGGWDRPAWRKAHSSEGEWMPPGSRHAMPQMATGWKGGDGFGVVSMLSMCPLVQMPLTPFAPMVRSSWPSLCGGLSFPLA
ncbi:hypothetical protein MaudCBS49596_007838 [Microsporum audouinii]